MCIPWCCALCAKWPLYWSLLLRALTVRRQLQVAGIVLIAMGIYGVASTWAEFFGKGPGTLDTFDGYMCALRCHRVVGAVSRLQCRGVGRGCDYHCLRGGVWGEEGQQMLASTGTSPLSGRPFYLGAS